MVMSSDPPSSSSTSSSSTTTTTNSSTLSRLEELDGTKHASSYVGFVVESQCVGQVHQDLLPLLLKHSPYFELEKSGEEENRDGEERKRKENAALHLRTAAPGEDLTSVMDKVTQVLIDHNVIKGRHGDMYPITAPTRTRTPTPPPNRDSGHGSSSSSSSSSSTPTSTIPICLIDRNAAPYFGVPSVGVHLLCYCRDRRRKPKRQQQKDDDDDNDNGSASNMYLWMAQRSSTKSHFPSLWDPTVAGGQPSHLSLYDNMVKEAYEEAGITKQEIERNNAIPVSCLSQMTSKPDGTCLKYSRYYCWEMEVHNNDDDDGEDANFRPDAVDGEVQKFELWDAATMLKEVRGGQNRLRPAMRLVVTDFLIRHGYITPDEEPDYAKIQSAMHRDRLILWESSK